MCDRIRGNIDLQNVPLAASAKPAAGRSHHDNVKAAGVFDFPDYLLTMREVR